MDEPKLYEWQKKLLNAIEKNKNLVILLPRSLGKRLLMETYFRVIKKKRKNG